MHDAWRLPFVFLDQRLPLSMTDQLIWQVGAIAGQMAGAVYGWKKILAEEWSHRLATRPRVKGGWWFSEFGALSRYPDIWRAIPSPQPWTTQDAMLQEHVWSRKCSYEVRNLTYWDKTAEIGLRAVPRPDARCRL